jgi:hypothetical protein
MISAGGTGGDAHGTTGADQEDQRTRAVGLAEPVRRAARRRRALRASRGFDSELRPCSRVWGAMHAMREYRFADASDAALLDDE